MYMHMHAYIKPSPFISNIFYKTILKNELFSSDTNLSRPKPETNIILKYGARICGASEIIKTINKSNETNV